MPLSRRNFLANSSLLAASSILPHRLHAQTGAPAGQPDAYAIPKPDLTGPFQPTWESLRDNYTLPTWFRQAKFGIFIHWGLYSIPAHGNEWYERHMYQDPAIIKWHTEHYGAPDKFGYKDFIPLFKTPNYHPDQWAELFERAGAKYVVPVAEHHDGFAMWNSSLTPWNAYNMGPHRDLTGELATAVRKRNLIFGLSTHRMEHAYFGYPAPGVPNDEFDSKYAGFYGPPIDQPFNSGNNSKPFQLDWLARVQELVDKYEPQLIYFDNGVNPREYDEVKLRAAAYYYNRARQWGKQATLATKDVAYLFGSVQDFENTIRAPKWPYAGGWECDTPIGNSWGYVEGLHVQSGDAIIRNLIAVASCGGNLLLNISPMGDGSIPDNQQQSLHTVGDWLKINGEAIYGSSAWGIPGEGPSLPATPPGDWKGGSTAEHMPSIKRPPATPLTEADFHFTANNGNLYAIGYKYPSSEAVIKSLSSSNAKVERVTLLGPTPTPIKFTQTAEALRCTLPPPPTPSSQPYTLRIEGSHPLGII
jgi:alpha-L-fucosidase